MAVRNSVQFGTLFFKNPSVGNILGSNHDDYKNIFLPCGSVKYVRNSPTLRRNLLPLSSAIQWVGFTECPYHTDYTASHTSLGLCVCCFRICTKACKTESWSVMSCQMCRDWERLFVAREFQSTQRLCRLPQTFWIKFGIGRRLFFSCWHRGRGV